MQYSAILIEKLASEMQAPTAFEELYLAIRAKEGRLYSHDEVLQLPEINDNHIHKKEWEIRKHSAERLLRYISKKKRFLNILEVGCGNGWLSHQLSNIPQTRVTGIDINTVELQQAKKVFQQKNNLHFIEGDIRDGVLRAERFDVIVFAASVQYFPSLSQVIRSALQRLNAGGETHILDTIFYTNKTCSAAQKRSQQYFTKLGYPAMADYYFHHTLKELDSFTNTVLYNPHALFHRLLKKNPFYWVRIKKEKE